MSGDLPELASSWAAIAFGTEDAPVAIKGEGFGRSKFLHTGFRLASHPPSFARSIWLIPLT